MDTTADINYEPIDTSNIVLPRWKKLQIKDGKNWKTIEVKTFGGWKGLRPGQYRVVMIAGNDKGTVGWNLYTVKTENNFIQ